MTIWTVTVEDVRQIFETPMADSQLQVFLEDARALCDDVLSSAGYGDSKLNRIARYLAAHLASALTPFTEEERIGDYQMMRAGKFGEALKSTSYGQTVLSLDTSGILDSLSKRPARMHVLIPTSEQ